MHMSRPTMEALTVSVSIERPWSEIYDFGSVPENFPAWASGLGSSLERASDGEWVAETSEGRVTIRFSEPNKFGVLDHTVIPAPGVEIYVPLRVVANGDAGSEVLLTLFRQPGMSDEKFAADAEWVLRDLQKLKALLEA
jgi:hypothetical protein